MTDDDRARAWISHIAAIQYAASQRCVTLGHRHRDGADHCPICSQRGDYRRCLLPDCPICGGPQTNPNGEQT